MKIYSSVLLVAALAVLSGATASPVFDRRDDTDLSSAPVDDTTDTSGNTIDNTTATNDSYVYNTTFVDENPSLYNSSDIQLVSDTAFCSFLPYAPGVDIATTENLGIPFCTNSSLGGYTFPEGYILTSHFLSTENYTQVTGTMNPAAYNMSITDDGGQYDNRDQSQHTCNGLDYFVNLVEPNGGTFCIRCCNSSADCNIGISQDGCVKVVPGDYS
ncbi:hypothetical protein G6F56_007108 [Rhizopus delemar]|uniref:Uncharacterized protein n=1 Tax=Rhizopus stolonifer TaxID=4846 RepID=A0A367KXA1_RHIST|nr:hypothetical protein G6F56_007108 [Rhizopus delemar]RCI06839.1 hypothetical protein CU098_013910 [Rhizopus stolonifer]